MAQSPYAWMFFVACLLIATFNQHRMLFWGILGAILMRGAMIAAGAQLIQRFRLIIYVFGALIVLPSYDV